MKGFLWIIILGPLITALVLIPGIGDILNTVAVAVLVAGAVVLLAVIGYMFTAFEPRRIIVKPQDVLHRYRQRRVTRIELKDRERTAA